MSTSKDLQSDIFDTIQKVKEGKISVETARALIGIYQASINLAKVNVDYINAIGGHKSPFFEEKTPWFAVLEEQKRFIEE